MAYTVLFVLHAMSLVSNAFHDHNVDGYPRLADERQIIFRDDGRQSCPSLIGPPVDNPTKSFWLTPEDNPLADEGSEGFLVEEADICIIGSGITGVSAAWHLSQSLKEHKHNTSVVILEAREFCSGATGRNGGHLRPNQFFGFHSRQAKYHMAEALKSYEIESYTVDALVKFLKERDLEGAVDLFEGGTVRLFGTQDEELASRRDFEAARTAGRNLDDVRWLLNRELVEQYGLSPDLNHTGVWGLGYNLWPCKLVTELYKDAQREASSSNISINLYTHTPVSSITRRHSFYHHRHHHHHHGRLPSWLIHTPRGKIKCTYVIHATNAYAGHLLPMFAGSTPAPSTPGEQPVVKSRRPAFDITPTRGQVGAVRASVPVSRFLWKNGWVGVGGWMYWFPRLQGVKRDTEQQETPLIILGGGRDSSGGTLEAGVSDDATLNERTSKALRSFLPDHFPGMFNESDALDDWTMEWTGIMGFTNNGDPFVGPVIDPANPGLDNHYAGQYIAAGYTGHGMTRAYACAEAVAGMIAAHITGDRWTAPEWLPERYLTWAAHSR